MSDTSGHDATRRDNLHTMTARELEAEIKQAGVMMSYRQVIRHCEAGTFDAQRMPGVNNVKTWFVAPASVEKGIADIKALQALRSQRDATRRDMSDSDAPKKPMTLGNDTSGHDATRLDVSEKKTQAERELEQRDMTRRVGSDLDIYEHPYVKRLEDRNEKLETKYEAQVRRTEEIQMKSQQQIIELQRMTAIGQSETLADFMLKAKDWLLGQGSDIEKREATPPPPAI
jgi:hypothetical protein